MTTLKRTKNQLIHYSIFFCALQMVRNKKQKIQMEYNKIQEYVRVYALVLESISINVLYLHKKKQAVSEETACMILNLSAWHQFTCAKSMQIQPWSILPQTVPLTV